MVAQEGEEVRRGVAERLVVAHGPHAGDHRQRVVGHEVVVEALLAQEVAVGQVLAGLQQRQRGRWKRPICSSSRQKRGSSARRGWAKIPRRRGRRRSPARSRRR